MATRIGSRSGFFNVPRLGPPWTSRSPPAPDEGVAAVGLGEDALGDQPIDRREHVTLGAMGELTVAREPVMTGGQQVAGSPSTQDLRQSCASDRATGLVHGQQHGGA